MIRVKSSVRPMSLLILAAAANTAHAMELAVDVVVTSGNDSTHMARSRHYTDEALDFRTKTMGAQTKRQFMADLKARLGADFDLVLEDDGGPNEHLHVEYDPKRPGEVNA